MRTILFLVRKEFLQVFRDKATVFQIFFIPIVQLLVLSQAATFDVKRTAIAVVDEDRTTTSAGLINRLAGGERFRVVRVQPTTLGIEEALIDREAKAVLQIPRGFEEALVRERHAPVQLQMNAEEGATAGIIQEAAQAIVLDYARDIAPTLASSPHAPVVVNIAPLDIRTKGLFNETRNYKHYMVPAILVSLVSIIGLLLTAQNIAREKELGTLEQLNVTPITKAQFIAGKLIPFWILALLIFTIGLTIGKFAFGIPTRGSVPLVFLAAAVYLIVALGIGLWISTFTSTQQQTMFVAFFILLIYLLMSGLFTPIESMPRWAQLVAQANPVKHFVFIMRAVLVRGAGIADIWRPLVGLTLGGVAVLSIAVRLHSKQVH
ncbi:MAG: ABC transporter permease [Gemmatimonadaceae bacterium]